MGLSALQQRYLAFGALAAISLSLLGMSVYQAYYANPVDSLYYMGEISTFTLPSTQGVEYSYIPGTHLITVVSFIYTKCPGDDGCALLSVNMADLEQRVDQKGWKDDVEFISIDFDYINDTMEDLSSYAKDYTNDFDFWHFLLGNKQQTHEVTSQFGFYFAVNNQTALGLSHGDENHDPYIHQMSTYFLDRDGNIRKIVTGTQWDFRDISNTMRFLMSDDWSSHPRG